MDKHHRLSDNDIYWSLRKGLVHEIKISFQDLQDEKTMRVMLDTQLKGALKGYRDRRVFPSKGVVRDINHFVDGMVESFKMFSTIRPKSIPFDPDIMEV